MGSGAVRDLAGSVPDATLLDPGRTLLEPVAQPRVAASLKPERDSEPGNRHERAHYGVKHKVIRGTHD